MGCLENSFTATSSAGECCFDGAMNDKPTSSPGVGDSIIMLLIPEQLMVLVYKVTRIGQLGTNKG